MKKLNETQTKILNFLQAHPDATPDIVIEGTNLAKITAYSSLKSLVTMKVITMKEEGGKKIYNAVSAQQPVKAVVGIINDNHQEEKKETQKKSAHGKRDFTKYKFAGETFSKGGLVRAMVAQYAKEKKPSMAKLSEVFPPELVPTYGVFAELSVAKKRSADKQRYFLKPEQLIKLKDLTIAVTNQITSAYLDNFLQAAKKVGMKALPA